VQCSIRHDAANICPFDVDDVLPDDADRPLVWVSVARCLRGNVTGVQGAECSIYIGNKCTRLGLEECSCHVV
jgi:hypothetical protein